MDEFFAAIAAGNVSAVRAFLEHDASLANAVTVRPSLSMSYPEVEDTRCGSGLPDKPRPPVKPRPPLTNAALQTAVRHRHLDIVRLLLEFGADVNAATEGESAALFVALHCGNLNFDLVRVLVEAGADVNARDRVNNVPLTSAFRWHQDALPVVELLLAHGADVNARTQQGRTPLDKAVLYLASPAIDHVRMIETLLRYGANPNPPRGDGQAPGSPLCMVVSSGNVRVARLLIEAGADVNATDRWGTPLTHAAAYGFDQLIRLLLDAGADPTVCDSEGRTPLGLVEPFENLSHYVERLLEQR
jgi:ankyrin repeat protein